MKDKDWYEDWYNEATSHYNGKPGFAIEKHPEAVAFIRKILTRLIEEKKRISVAKFVKILNAKFGVETSTSSLREYLKNRTDGLYEKTLGN